MDYRNLFYLECPKVSCGKTFSKIQTTPKTFFLEPHKVDSIRIEKKYSDKGEKK